MAKRALVVYYSWSNGNTERIAQMAANALGAEAVAIQTTEPYPDDYDETVSLGKREVDEGVEREIEPLGVDLADYDVIAVGTPTWWYTMAPAVLAWFRSSDLSGKTVVPFMTNGGWPGSVIDDMTAEAEDAGAADVDCDQEVRFDSQGGANLKTSQRELDSWLADLRDLVR